MCTYNTEKTARHIYLFPSPLGQVGEDRLGVVSATSRCADKGADPLEDPQSQSLKQTKCHSTWAMTSCHHLTLKVAHFERLDDAEELLMDLGG